VTIVRDARRKPMAPVRVTALRMLARREYSRAELEQRLIARGAEQHEVTPALDDLERRGYLSDARFAQMLVAQKAGRFGKRAIAQAMHVRRVEASAAAGALDTVSTADEAADARALWARRFGAAPRDERERARQIRFLLARGYALAIAFDIVGRPTHSSTGRVDAADGDAITGVD